MRILISIFKRQFWPISALVFAPWHASLALWAVSRLTADTALGVYIAAHDNTIRPIVIVLFSLYFTLAFMMWVAGKRAASSRVPESWHDADSQHVLGLSGKQILGWGLLGILTIPIFIWISMAGQQSYLVATFEHIFGRDPSANLGFVWLISIAMLIMIPTMVVWLVWMWRAWAKTDRAQIGADQWDYEYEV